MDSVAMPLCPPLPFSPSRLPCAWVTSALCLGPAHPRCLPTGQHECETGGVGKYLGTFVLSVSHLGFAVPASQSMIPPLMTQQSWAEQSRKGQHRAEQSLI